jgi:MFS family permease
MAWVSQETEHFWSLEFITALAHLPVSSGRPRFVPYLTATPDLIFIVFILDRVGRRKPLLWGTIGITLALICEAIVNSQITRDDDKVIIANDRNNSLSIAGVFFIFSVSVIFSLSFGPISWVYMSEIMPMQIRARGNAFATGIGNWLVSTFWAQVSPTALKELSWKFYFLFVGMYPHPLSPGLTISDNDGAQHGTSWLPSPSSSSSSRRQIRSVWRTSICSLARGRWARCQTTCTRKDSPRIMLRRMWRPSTKLREGGLEHSIPWSFDDL